MAGFRDVQESKLYRHDAAIEELRVHCPFCKALVVETAPVCRVVCSKCRAAGNVYLPGHPADRGVGVGFEKTVYEEEPS